MHYDRSTAGKNFDELFAGFNFQPIPYIDKEVMERKWDITDKLKKLSPQTKVYCGHEYTLANLYFAKTVEPDNQSILQKIKKTFCASIDFIRAPGRPGRIHIFPTEGVPKG